MSAKAVWYSMMVVVASAASATAQETLESVEKHILQMIGNDTTMSARVVSTIEESSDDFSITTTKRGSYEYMKTGQAIRFRRESLVTGVESVAGEKTKFEQTELIICDGQNIYTLMDNMGHKSAVRVKADRTRTGGIDKALFARWHRAYNMVLLTDGEVDEHATYVIEAKPKKTDSVLPARTLYFFRKDNGVMVKRVQENSDGKIVESTTYSDVRINEKIDPQRFVFKAPEGVRVKDRFNP